MATTDFALSILQIMDKTPVPVPTSNISFSEIVSSNNVLAIRRVVSWCQFQKSLMDQLQHRKVHLKGHEMKNELHIWNLLEWD